MDAFWFVVRIAAAVYVGLSLFLFVMQSRYIYYPDKTLDMTPGDVGLKYDDLMLKTEDGESISAWYVPAATNSDSAVTLLDCHGNAGDMGDRVNSVLTFHNMGYNLMIFDYRGYGKSSGKPTEDGTYKDAMAAWNYLVHDRGMPTNRIVVFGRSLGGAVASWLARDVNPAALVLESVFTSAPDMAAMLYSFLPSRLLCRFKYDTVDNVRNVKCPVFVAHSGEDEMIPFEHGQKIFSAAGEPKAFFEMRGGHNAGGLDIHPEYQQILERFIDEHVGKNPGAEKPAEVR